MSELSVHLLPEADCKSGISEDLLREHLGEIRWAKFTKWIYGQTIALCERGDSKPCETPHGMVYYPWDIRRFLMGYEVID